MKIRRIAPPPDSLRGYPAGFITRYVAFLLDVLLVVAVSFLAVTITRLTLDFFGFTQLVPQSSQPRATVNISAAWTTALRVALTIIGGFLTFGVYSIVAWVLTGKTVGKALMGLRVLGQDGRPITLRQAVIRALGYYVSGLALFAGFLWVLIDDRRQTWHDKLANTIVVYEWDAQYEEKYVAAVRTLEDSNQRRQALREQAMRMALEGDEPMEAPHVSTNDYPPLQR